MIFLYICRYKLHVNNEVNKQVTDFVTMSENNIE